MPKVAIVIFVLFAIAFIFLLFKRWLVRKLRSREFSLTDKKAWAEKWASIEALVDQGETHWSIAVIEADKLFDRVLKAKSLPGKDMGERLRFLTRSKPQLRYVWPAHLTRNRLVHEANYQPDRGTARRAVHTFGKALRELGVL
ncbi:MAG: hypothetical protein WC052_00655 [Patescibacteria group bacterium]|jgi:hypothetical protein